MQKIVDNETLGYFLGRVQLFLEKIGIERKRMRCRQHMANEMAHYAAVRLVQLVQRPWSHPRIHPQDCWDFEIQSSYGWIECVGCADRSAYDLTVHANKTKQKLVVKETLSEPLVYDKLMVTIEPKAFGMKFKKEASGISNAIKEMSQDDLAALKSKLENG